MQALLNFFFTFLFFPFLFLLVRLFFLFFAPLCLLHFFVFLTKCAARQVLIDLLPSMHQAANLLFFMHKTSALISLKHACVADTSYGKIWTFLSCGKRDWEEHRNKLSQISRLSFLNQYRPKKQWRWNMTMHKDYRFCLSRRRKFSHTRNTRKMERINLMDVTQGKQNLTLETKNKT